MKDYYATLGVERDASKDEIKKAFRKLSMEHHPDQGGDEDKFKEINEAYSVLNNDKKRQEYDNPNPFGGIFGNMSGFGFPGMRRQAQKPDLNAPRDGKFIGVEVELPAKTFIFGGKYKLKVSYHEGCTDCGGKGFTEGEECDVCHGSGYVQHVDRRPGFMSSSMRPCNKCQGRGMVATEKCETCRGSGNIYVENKEFDFDIPPGTNIGSRFGLTGVGRAGLNGGKNGDVAIMVAGIKQPNLNNLSEDQREELKNLLEVLENADASA